MSDLTRPLVRYHGGKWKLAPWILSFFPQHRVYVEPYGGGGSVLLRKERSYAEIYNDLDGEIVNLFRVARDHGDELDRLLRLTPFARAEFDLSYEVSESPVEQARRTLVRSFMGFGSASVSMQKSGFRANSNKSGTTPAHDWANYPDAFKHVIERLSGVVVENRKAIDCMMHHDTVQTLHYVDPPYVKSTRYMNNKTHCYRHEMDDVDHAALAAALKQLMGCVVLSGYACDLYDKELFSDWTRFERPAFADGAKERTEVIWINDACKHALEERNYQEALFA
ncbi:MAG TPA: DNA adenine methylase [Methylophilus sp.]|uniref:DNA adenine methylase n=1 Tax=Methylophilus sp. TaxID=29541 RepID=UPI002C8D79CD|nr:DNA adenine methylase [Methylophilus sp.]HSH86874.1 DNA adenine methylase [Methylophilus sp.]